MASRTRNSMKVSNKKPPVKEELKVEEQKPEPVAPIVAQPDLPKPKAKSRKRKVTSPEDAIMQSLAVDPDLDKAVKAKKSVRKPKISSKVEKKKPARRAKAKAKKPVAKKATPKKD